MPAYDYECKICGIIPDVVQSIHDEALTKCPKCSGDVRRLIVAPRLSVEVNYYDENLEAHITSWGQRKQLMREKGLRDGRGEDDRRIIQNKKMHADKLNISVAELNRRFDRQREQRAG